MRNLTERENGHDGSPRVYAWSSISISLLKGFSHVPNIEAVVHSCSTLSVYINE
ncbi:MAG: hypothetical protein MJZ29_00960 [Bacteroidaceae bacterium]|nr:hypothetical protein [Bacteroidaceae bacterium]